MKIRTISILGLVAIAAIGASTFQAVSIKWVPKVGTTYKYSMKANMNLGPLGEASMSAKMSSTAAKIDGNKVTVQTTQTAGKMVMGGAEQDSPDGSATQVCTLFGEVLSTKSEPEAPFDLSRMQDAVAFLYPSKDIAVGESWTRTSKLHNPGSVPSESTYKYEGDEEVNGMKCRKISYTYKETSADNKCTASGTFWISVDDSEPVKAINSVKNCELAGVGSFDMDSTTVREK